MIVKIKRQEAFHTQPYWQSFSYDGERTISVAALLDDLNDREELLDVEGMPARKIRWACSCMQGVCGACSMIINGTPALACKTFLRDLPTDELRLEPLTKFPTACDLIVDRDVIEEGLQRARLYIGEWEQPEQKESEFLYTAAKCLKCGLCLEVCPNYGKGERFLGGLFANQARLTLSQSRERKAELLGEYRAHFAAGCSKALSCQKVCPVGISTLSSMLKLNRLRMPKSKK